LWYPFPFAEAARHRFRTEFEGSFQTRVQSGIIFKQKDFYFDPGAWRR
jgi:hypothetical protein